MIAVVDYGAGNVQSVVNALQRLDADCILTANAQDIRMAEAVIVPGVGAARDTMRNLERANLIEPLLDIINSGTPYLGICMGMQALLTFSDEHGGHPCLDIIPGTVKHLSVSLPVPHMGWNDFQLTARGSQHPLLAGIPSGAEFYFAHSYACAPERSEHVLAETDYDGKFAAVIGYDNVMAVQFHPEKSGPWGLKLLANFLDVSVGGVVDSVSIGLDGSGS